MSVLNPVKPSNPVIRSATENDYSAIIQIVEEISVQAPEKKSQFNWDRFQIGDELQKSATWVVSRGEVVEAFLCAREAPDFFEITVLATALQVRKQGLQSQLMKTVLLEATGKNKNVLLEVHEENLSAINFYRKLGFAELPKRKNYYSDGKSALVFIYQGKET